MAQRLKSTLPRYPQSAGCAPQASLGPHLGKLLDLGHHDADILSLIHVLATRMVDLVVRVNDQAMDAVPGINPTNKRGSVV
jgi:hypothetical protein